MIWKIATEENRDWVELCKAKYLQKTQSILRIENPPQGSTFWNGLMQVKKLISDFTRWEIGKGDQVYFWEDAWLKEKPLIKYKDYKELAQWAIQNQGEMVNDYVNLKETKWIIKMSTHTNLREGVIKLGKLLKRKKISVK